MTPPQSLDARDLFDRWKSSLRGFWRLWRRPVVPVRGLDVRHLNAIAVLLACGSTAAVGIMLDEPGFEWSRSLSPPVIHVFAQITRLGDSLYVFALTVAAAATAVGLRGRGRGWRFDMAMGVVASRAMYLFVVAAGSGLASQFLKHLFGRARPQLHAKYPDMIGLYHFDLLSIWASYASFPSGHAVTAFAMAAALAFMSPRVGWPLLLVACAVGWSRVASGSHYPSDVVAGAGLGVASAVVARVAFARRRIVFEKTPRGVRLRGAGVVAAALRRR